MPQQITAWKADDGSIHDTECDAATRDVELLVQRSPLAENQPFARQLVAWLTDNADEITKRLAAHGRACPKAAKAEAPLESGEGPVVSRPDIPSGVYWSASAENFYDRTRTGMGQRFFEDWYERREEFPQNLEDAINGD